MKIVLGNIAYTRSGDKGPNANVGIIFINKKFYEWGKKHITSPSLKKYLMDLVKGDIKRYELSNLNALNFILHDSLGGGGSETLINDAQGKTFGQILSVMEINIPENLTKYINLND